MSLDLTITGTCESCNRCHTYFNRNITHNLMPMWKKAGVYDVLYNSEGKVPLEVLPDAEKGYLDMLANKKEYQRLNSENGWGTYESAIDFLGAFVDACKECVKNGINSGIEVWK